MSKWGKIQLDVDKGVYNDPDINNSRISCYEAITDKDGYYHMQVFFYFASTLITFAIDRGFRT